MIRLGAALCLIVTVAIAPALPASSFHHDVDVALDLDAGRIEVRVRIISSEPLPRTLRLAPWLAVTAASLDGRPVEIERDGDLLVIDRRAGAGSILIVAYAGTPPAAPSPEAPIIGPAGAFLPAGTRWLPDLGGGAASFRVDVSVRSPYRAVATGRLVTEEADEVMYRAEFAADDPGEPPSLFAGPYEIRERWHGELRLRTYFAEERNALADTYLQRLAGLVDRFEDRIGAYPFASLFIVSAPLPVGLGFPGVVYVSDAILPLPFMQGPSLAHEVLHNWWGNGVRVDYARGNWSEGLTTYMADHALAAEDGADRAREMRLGWLRDYAALPPRLDRPLSRFTARRLGSDHVIGYGKAAFVFHMLGHEVGDAAFARALRLLWTRYRGRTAGWDELRLCFEEASARDLGWFFEQWVDRAGAPRLDLETAEVAAREDGYRVAIGVAQGDPPFRLSLRVAIETEGGVREHRLTLAGQRVTVEIPVADRPTAIAVDAGHDTFRRLHLVEAPPILRAATFDPAIVAVIAADGPEASVAARRLAERLLEHEVAVAARPPADAAVPFVLAGTAPEIEAALARAGLGPVPETLAGRGTARVWTGRRPSGQTYVVVAGDDAAALDALRRSLPHHGGMSYLAFDGAKALAKGVWPVGDSPLRRALAP